MRPASVGFHCPEDVAIARKTIRPQRSAVGAVLRDSPPYVTAVLIAANIAVYVVTGLQSSTGLARPGDGVKRDSLFDKWQLVPTVVHADHSYYRLLTSSFVHVNLLHIGSNMLALFFVGPALERVIGRWRFLAVYVLSALGGSALIYLAGTPGLPVVGASGAIFGLFGACLVLVRKLGLDLQWLVAIIVINFVFTFSVADISRLGHIGGFVVGCVAALVIGGLPQARQRIPDRLQFTGLGVILVALVVAVLVRSSTGTF
jgi:membrane associated rhomboid family serine protease